MRYRVFLLLWLLPSLAFAQVQQSGTVTPGHPVMWTTTGVVQDAGASSNGKLTGLGITSANLSSLCINNGPQSAAYSALCLGINGTTAAVSVTAFGGATLPTFTLPATTVSGPLNLSGWTTAGRPSSPANYAVGFNTSLSTIDVWNGSAWQNPSTFIGGAVPNATEFEAAGTGLTVDHDAVVSGNLFVTGTHEILGSSGTNAGELLFNNNTSGNLELTVANGVALSGVLTLPNHTGTLALLGLAQTWAAAQTYPTSDILIGGSSTGTTAIASANASATNYTDTLPAATGTVALTSQLEVPWTCAVPIETGTGAGTLTCFTKVPRGFTVDNITATVLGTFTTVTPTIYECGTSTDVFRSNHHRLRRGHVRQYRNTDNGVIRRYHFRRLHRSGTDGWHHYVG